MNNILIITFNSYGVEFKTFNFVDALIAIIKKSSPQLIVWGFQEASHHDEKNMVLEYFDQELQKLFSYQMLNPNNNKNHVVSLERMIRYESRFIDMVIYSCNDFYSRIRHVDYISYTPPFYELEFGKGALCIRIILNDSRELIFINAHLPIALEAKHMGYTMRLHFVNKMLQYFKLSEPTESQYIFFFGDLNFRLDKLFNSRDQLSYSLNPTLNDIKFDKSTNQLLKELRSLNYQEAPITFAPTFKKIIQADDRSRTNTRNNYLRKVIKCNPLDYLFEIRSDDKTLEEEQELLPSWCDRILFSSNIFYLVYDAYDLHEVQLSDHALVYGIYVYA
jgi:endonuclease/exonuclease/phosphatase family metal-dependent hydrolase